MSELSYLEKLLDGAEVEWKALGDVAGYSSTRIDADKIDATSFIGVDNLIADKGGRIDATYLPNTTRITAYEQGDILLGNIRPYLKKVWMATNSGGCSGDVLAIRISEDYKKCIRPEYLYYLLSSNAFFSYNMQHSKGAKMPRGSKGAILNYRIPILCPENPKKSLAIQSEIIRILDSFNALTAELTAELTARKKQYNYYRDQLLSFKEGEVEWKTLEEIGHIVTGRTPKSSDKSAWGDDVDFVTPSDIKNGMRNITCPSRRLSAEGAASMPKVRIPSGSLLVTCIGADMGKTVINTNDCIPNQQINAITLTDDSVQVGYLFHVLTAMRETLRRQGELGGGTMPLINKSDFSKIVVPVPSYEEQNRIATTLDKFDALTNSITEGLPREIALRQQQYEYYRDLLFSFPKPDAVSQ